MGYSCVPKPHPLPKSWVPYLGRGATHSRPRFQMAEKLSRAHLKAAAMGSSRLPRVWFHSSPRYVKRLYWKSHPLWGPLSRTGYWSCCVRPRCGKSQLARSHQAFRMCKSQCEEACILNSFLRYCAHGPVAVPLSNIREKADCHLRHCLRRIRKLQAAGLHLHAYLQGRMFQALRHKDSAKRVFSVTMRNGPCVDSPTPPPMVMPSKRLTWQQPAMILQLRRLRAHPNSLLCLPRLFGRRALLA